MMKFDWSRLNWPQAIVLIVVILAAVGGAVALTVTNTWDKVPWQTLAAAITVVGGTGVSAFLGKLVHDPPRDTNSKTRSTDDGGGT